MPFDSKTLTELVETEKDDYRTRIPEGDLSDGSDLDIEARVHAAAVFGNQAHAQYLSRQALPDTADADHLLRHATTHGVQKRTATAAAGRVSILLDGGSPPLVQANASELTTPDGFAYETTESTTVSLPTWSGKTTARGMTLTRVPILPHVSGMERGHRISIVGSGERTIVRVLSSIQSVEVNEPFDGVVATGVTVTPIASGFAPVGAGSSGVATNQSPGEACTLSSPTAGLNSGAFFVEMTGGADNQTTDSLRRDVQSDMAVRPGSGNLQQWRKWTKETPGVGVEEAFIYPGLRGLGTVSVVPLGATGVRQLGTERNSEILEYLLEQHAFDDDAEVLMFSWVGAPQDYLLEVRPGIGFEADVPDAPFTLHGATASTTTRLQALLATDLDLVQVGDRLVVTLFVDGLAVTQQVRVTGTLDAGTNDYQIDVERLDATGAPVGAMSAAPSLSGTVYSGGPLWQIIMDELAKYFDTLGPGDTSPPSRWPRSSDEWQGDLRGAETLKRIQALTGVADSRVVTPIAPVGGNPGDVTTPPLYIQRLGWVRIIWE